jgi:hypothetical protein
MQDVLVNSDIILEDLEKGAKKYVNFERYSNWVSTE